MPITIHLPAVLARLSDGQRKITTGGATVGDAVAEVSSRYPALRSRLVDDTGDPYPFVTYYLNDDDIASAAVSVRRCMMAIMSFSCLPWREADYGVISHCGRAKQVARSLVDHYLHLSTERSSGTADT